jgi:hypothetical protein
MQMNNTSEGRSRLPTTELPDELRQALGRLYDLPLTTNRGDLDVHLADCISRSCMTLLNEEWDRAEGVGKRLIQAACHYFVENDDEDRDLESVYGFDDDAEVVNAILELLNRQDLTIQI